MPLYPDDQGCDWRALERARVAAGHAGRPVAWKCTHGPHDATDQRGRVLHKQSQGLKQVRPNVHRLNWQNAGRPGGVVWGGDAA